VFGLAEAVAACEALRGSAADYPFGPGVRVYKVMGKVFALLTEEEPYRISLKCDPDLAEILRASFAAVQSGYHLNKRHWNTLSLDGSMPDDQVEDLIRHSYELVVKSLKRSERDALSRSA
jgi:predicted DNA-binding protein (MmcQ/YjbR family)